MKRLLSMNLQKFAETVVDVPDDGVQNLEIEPIEPIDEPTEPIEVDPIEEPTEPIEPTEDDIPELPPEQKNAFQKRLEREQKKIRDQVEAESIAKYAKHQRIIDSLGGDPDAIEKAFQEQEWTKEAQSQGYEKPEESAWYIAQKKQQAELNELRVKVQINELKDDPLYAGIKGSEKEIQAFMTRTGSTAKEAYWAIGGEARAQQLKREAEQRAIVKKAQPKRTVQSDSATGDAGTLPALPSELEAQRKQMGLSHQEALDLLGSDYANIDDYRKQKQLKQKKG